MTAPRVATFLGYVAVAAAANLVTSWFGLIHIGPLAFAAGTFFAGFALCLRNVLQEVGGIPFVLAGIVVGTAVSFVTGSGQIAVASACAFLLAELFDFAVYTPLRRRHGRFAVAVIAANLVGSIVDSLVFLTLSGLGASVAAVTGQVAIKWVVVTGVFVLVFEVANRLRRPQAVTA